MKKKRQDPAAAERAAVVRYIEAESKAMLKHAKKLAKEEQYTYADRHNSTGIVLANLARNIAERRHL